MPVQPVRDFLPITVPCDRTASIPVLVIAQAMQGDRERFLPAGFDGYLSKPLDIRELADVVRQHSQAPSA